MIYVSLTVHEKFDVVASQLKNFQKYLPNVMVVIHLSTVAYFSTKELDGFLKLNRLDNYIINPTQVDTAWGGIISAHLENIDFILRIGDATKIVFHSSNDMLVKEGLLDFLNDREFLFHNRKILPNSFWWPGNVALNDLSFTDWLAVCGGGLIVASQIEGSMYPVEFLREFRKSLQTRGCLALASSMKYPKEEFFFSSFASSQNIIPDGQPYIFSEVHRFDKKLWFFHAVYSLLFNDEHYLAKYLKGKIAKKLFNDGSYKISLADIKAIRNKDLDYFKDGQYMSDGANLWQVYDAESLYGVKRVSRVMTDKVRQYLSVE